MKTFKLMIWLMIMSIYLNAELVTKNEFHVGHMYNETTINSTDLTTLHLYSKIKKFYEDKVIVSLKAENMIFTYNVESKASFASDEYNTVFISIIDEFYIRYNLNNHCYLLGGKMDFRTDNGTFLTLAQDRNNNINPLMSNYIADGLYLGYHNDQFIFTVGASKKDLLFESILVNSDDVESTFYSSIKGISILALYKNKKHTFIYNNYVTEGMLVYGSDIHNSIYGITYLYNDIIDSGIVFYTYLAYSDSRYESKDYSGYAYLVGISKFLTLPYINREITVGSEMVSINNDYVSLNTGKYLSPYAMSMNGKQYIGYFKLDTSNRTSIKVRGSIYKPNEATLIPGLSIDRIYPVEDKTLYDIRLEFQYNF